MCETQLTWLIFFSHTTFQKQPKLVFHLSLSNQTSQVGLTGSEMLFTLVSAVSEHLINHFHENKLSVDGFSTILTVFSVLLLLL